MRNGIESPLTRIRFQSQTPGLAALLLGLLACAAALLSPASTIAIQAQPPAEAKEGGNEEPAKPDATQPENPAPDNPAPGKKREGRLVRIGLPLVSGDDERLRSLIERTIEPLADQTPRHLLVLEFYIKPSAEKEKLEEFAQSSQFGPAYELAKFLSELSKVQKIAYIPERATGHAVLVAMACDEIHMAPSAVIGEAGIAEDGPIDAVRRSGYKTIFDRRRTIPLALALGMLDKELVVYQVDTDTGRDFVLAEDLEEFRTTHLVKGEPTAIIQRGQFGKFTGTEGRNLGFVKFLPRTREHLATELELPVEALEQDPSLGGEWRTMLVTIDGTIDHNTVGRVQDAISGEINRRDVNFVCVRIESKGGDPASSMALATFLAELDPTRVRTVAYIGGEARADAALVALACDHVVMSGEAKLGGESAFELDERQVTLVNQTVQSTLAPAKSRNWSLVAALVDPSVEVYRYTRQGERDVLVEYFSPDEAAEREQRDGQPWQRGEAIKRPGEPLELDGAQAKEFRLANHLVEDFNQFKTVYHITEELVEPKETWARQLLRALAQPGLAWLLLAIGFGAMYIEMHTPGVGVAGFVSGLCFLVYFWGQFLNGNAQWLEVMLFVGGVMCVLLELLVLPGFGIFGFGGALMIVSSLILASQTFYFPSTDYEMSEFRDSLMVVGLGMAGCVAIAIALRKVLPRAPLLGRVVLAPPEGDAAATIRQREAIVDLSFLVGQRGTMTTPCSPAGIARFDDELIHVVSDGDFIPRGAAVVAIEAHGNRVVVRLADRA